MAEPDSSVKITVFEIGCLARAALAVADSATVAAVSGRSIYLRSGQNWFCLGPDRLGAGPLNMRCHLSPNWDWRAQGVEIGAYAQIGESRLQIDPDLRANFTGAATWTPAQPRMAEPERSSQAVSVLTDLIVERVPSAGLGQLGLRCGINSRRVQTPALGVTEEEFDPESLRRSRGDASVGIESHAVMAAASNAAAALDRLLHTALAKRISPPDAAAAPLRQLIGLGPGLTPSGDDFLGGAMIALHQIGEHRLADRLWRLLQKQLAGRTHEISVAHLTAAARGYGNAALHALLADVLSGDTSGLEQRVVALDAVGHTSGWDGLAGALSVLHAWLRVSTRCVNAQPEVANYKQQQAGGEGMR